MRKYTYVLYLRIAACFASMSSRDAYLYKVVDKAPENYESVTIDPVARIKTFYLKPDETFSDRILVEHRRGNMKLFEDFAKHPDFLAHVQKYRYDGWGDEPDWHKEARKAYWERYDAARAEKRKRLGYVLWQADFKTIKPHEYQGGFSEEVFNSPHLKRYVEGGGLFGYIGHSCRKPCLDAYIEKQFLALKLKIELTRAERVDLLGVWLTSTDGRHFGDSLDNAGNFVKQKQFIRERVQDMFNTAYIYSRPEHKGTLKSTNELSEKYKENLLD